MREFRDTLTEFRSAMREEGAHSVCPDLTEMMERERRVRNHRLRRALAAAALTLMLAAIPFYQNQQKRRETERDQADSVLFQQVHEGLARPVSPALAPLLGMGN